MTPNELADRLNATRGTFGHLSARDIARAGLQQEVFDAWADDALSVDLRREVEETYRWDALMLHRLERKIDMLLRRTS